MKEIEPPLEPVEKKPTTFMEQAQHIQQGLAEKIEFYTKLYATYEAAERKIATPAPSKSVFEFMTHVVATNLGVKTSRVDVSHVRKLEHQQQLKLIGYVIRYFTALQEELNDCIQQISDAGYWKLLTRISSKSSQYVYELTKRDSLLLQKKDVLQDFRKKLLASTVWGELYADTVLPDAQDELLAAIIEVSLTYDGAEVYVEQLLMTEERKFVDAALPNLAHEISLFDEVRKVLSVAQIPEVARVGQTLLTDTSVNFYNYTWYAHLYKVVMNYLQRKLYALEIEEVANDRITQILQETQNDVMKDERMLFIEDVRVNYLMNHLYPAVIRHLVGTIVRSYVYWNSEKIIDSFDQPIAEDGLAILKAPVAAVDETVG
jgi:hypothetical protein